MAASTTATIGSPTAPASDSSTRKERLTPLQKEILEHLSEGGYLREVGGGLDLHVYFSPAAHLVGPGKKIRNYDSVWTLLKRGWVERSRPRFGDPWYVRRLIITQLGRDVWARHQPQSE